MASETLACHSKPFVEAWLVCSIFSKMLNCSIKCFRCHQRACTWSLIRSVCYYGKCSSTVPYSTCCLTLLYASEAEFRGKAGQSNPMWTITWCTRLLLLLFVKRMCCWAAKSGQVFLSVSMEVINKECNALLWVLPNLVLSLLARPAIMYMIWSIVKLLFTVAAKWKTDYGYCAMLNLKAIQINVEAAHT